VTKLTMGIIGMEIILLLRFSKWPSSTVVPFAYMRIRCSDSAELDPNIVTTERIFEETIRISRTVWPMIASIIYSEHFCHRYTSRAVERYAGPWNVQPKNVVLVLGNQGE
jgi:hypothetical protein